MASKANFKKIDITRAVQAVRAGGVSVGRVEIDASTGRIVIVSAQDVAAPSNDLDYWMRNNAG